MTTDLDSLVRTGLAIEIASAPKSDVSSLLERGAGRRAARLRRRRFQARGAAALSLAILGGLAVLSVGDREQTGVAGSNATSSATSVKQGTAVPFSPDGFEVVTVLQDGRSARLFLQDGVCVQIEREPEECRGISHASGLSWFAMPLGDVDLVAIGYILDPVVIVAADGVETAVVGEFGPGAVYRALVEVPNDDDYEVRLAERNVLLTAKYEQVLNGQADVWRIAESRQVCVELKAKQGTETSCHLRFDLFGPGITISKMGRSGLTVLYGTAPPSTDVMVVELDGVRTELLVASDGEMVVWLSQLAVPSTRGPVTVSAFELVESDTGELTRLLLTTERFSFSTAPGLDPTPDGATRSTTDTSAGGIVNIPSIDLEVFFGEDPAGETARSLPLSTVNENGSQRIFAARTIYGAPFLGLDEVQAGAEIHVITDGGTFTYVVRVQPDGRGHAIVDGESGSTSLPENPPALTLASTHPRYSDQQEIVVEADLASP